MSLDKAIASGKEHRVERRRYHCPKCVPHGGCRYTDAKLHHAKRIVPADLKAQLEDAK